MSLAEHELEHHHQLDDLLQALSPVGACAHAGGALLRDAQHVYKHLGYLSNPSRRNVGVFHPGDLSYRDGGPESATHLCICPCLDHVLH
jgi:hypothetical protein